MNETARIGDNSGVSGDRLRSFVERIERLEEDKAAVAEDIGAVYSEAGSDGFDKKIIRQVVKLRKMDKQKREEQQELLDLYLSALGDYATTELGQAGKP